MKVRLFSFSIFSHVFAIPFVSCLLGSKSWKHNGSCLGLDNSHNEWEWERREGQGERKTERGHRKLSSHHTVIFFLFFDVMFHKALCFQFIYLVKGLEGLTSCSVTSAGVKREVNSFSSHKLKQIRNPPEDECGIALPVQAREAAQHQLRLNRREGEATLSNWALGEKMGERLRSVQGGGSKCGKGEVYSERWIPCAVEDEVVCLRGWN